MTAALVTKERAQAIADAPVDVLTIGDTMRDIGRIRADKELLHDLAATVVAQADELARLRLDRADAEAEAARRTDTQIAVAEALGLRSDATAAEIVAVAKALRAIVGPADRSDRAGTPLSPMERLEASLTLARDALDRTERERDGLRTAAVKFRDAEMAVPDGYDVDQMTCAEAERMRGLVEAKDSARKVLDALLEPTPARAREGASE